MDKYKQLYKEYRNVNQTNLFIKTKIFIFNI